MTLLLVTTLRDPGIIPRNIDGLSPDSDLYNIPRMNFHSNSYQMTLSNQSLPLKFCPTCFIYRPPRTVHCRVCDNCVQVLDHHCVWLDTCIGKRNYPQFFSFLLSLSLFSLCTLVSQAIYFSGE